MATESIRISQKELSSNEVLTELNENKRVIVTVEILGVTTDVVLRKDGEEYVCDTGFKLMTYEDREGMKKCIERLRLANPE